VALRAELARALQQRDQLARQLHERAPAAACSGLVALSYEAAVLRNEYGMVVAQRDALLQEREELHAVVLAAFDAGGVDVDAADDIPFVAARLAPLQEQLIRATADREMLAAERDALSAQLLSCRELLAAHTAARQLTERRGL
jgi:hypothetical protein